MNINIRYNDNTMFGGNDVSDLNVEQTRQNYETSLYEAVAEEYPDAKIVVERNDNNGVTVDGQSAGLAVDAVNDIIDRVWSSYDYVVFA